MRIVFPSIRTAATHLTKAVGAIALGAALLLQTPASASANEKYAAFVIDANNGNVLFSRYADEYRYPASLTKMMTLYLTFDALQSGQISLSSPMRVSSYAAGRPPSKLGLKAGSSITVEEGIYALVTKSANDAAVVMGEFLGGTEARFASLMTAKARQLGMSKTTFKNAHGLPDNEQRTTARDMATLGIALREHFPQYYRYFNTRSYNFRGTRLGNHNRVLTRVEGTDGIKTGYINASGFNLVSSVVRGDKKLVAVVMGGRSGRSRDDHMVELLNKYLPLASSRHSEPLLAARTGASYTVAQLPKEGPVPAPRPTTTAMTIESRIALAYGSDSAGAVAAMPVPNTRPVVGRDAIRAALVQERPRTPLQIPVASGMLSPPAAPLPPAAIPGGQDLDPTTTGSVAPAPSAAPSSPWVVQIAAAPSQAQALEMLGEAKRTTGGILARAVPFTETVNSGSETLYRARFAGFSTKDEAWDACAALKRSSYACYAIAN